MRAGAKGSADDVAFLKGKAKKATAALSQLRHAQASMVAAATQKL